MPDKWEYPWFAAWDLAFHCVAMARVDPHFAKQQILLLCREWYMHPNGQLPAYEFAFGDVNPPVHAWAAWRVYQLAAARGYGADRHFLESAFQKCVVNFTWWVNRKDVDGNNLFGGGFLGLDNIGVFDRSKPLPGGGQLEQADATAWMAFYCTTMLAMALELAREDRAYADIASKFFEHFVAIARAMNQLGGTGLWDEDDGFYYDQMHVDGRTVPLRIRSMVGLIPLFAAETLDDRASRAAAAVPLAARLVPAEQARAVADGGVHAVRSHGRAAAPGHPAARAARAGAGLPARRERVPVALRDPLAVAGAPRGALSVPQSTARWPRSTTRPGVSDTGLFGGNSNWRGPVWFPGNYLLIEALKRHHHFYRGSLMVECPTGSGRRMTLMGVAEELERRLARLFMPGEDGRRPCHGDSALYRDDPHFRGLVLFHEYFHGDTGQGLGASHQTGWTALAANIIERVAMARERGRGTAAGRARVRAPEPTGAD